MEKKAYETSVDRISQLPESVICEILSRLPITDSVATCLLSRSWRHRWKDLQVFNFSTLSFLNQNRFPDEQAARTRFLAFVNEVLLHHRRATVRKLRIRYHKFHPHFDGAALKAWVCAAIGSHLEELKLESQGWDFMAPSRLFTSCTSLVTLELSCIFNSEELTRVRFPSLKNLKLIFRNPNLVTTILSGSPILETLDLRVATELRVLKIHSPSLKRLYFCDLRSIRTELVEINTPLLEYLSLRICSPQYDLISDCIWHNLVEANINCYAEGIYVAYIPKLLKSLCKVKSSLVLHPNTIYCLVRATQFDLPEFRYLLNLELVRRNVNTKFLFRMLERCPMLHVLTIHQFGVADPVQHAWTQPTNVPHCLASQLSIVNFKTYHGSKDDQELIAYILREGLALKSISIGFGYVPINSDQGLRMVNELSHLPKGSNVCQLYFK